MDRRKFSTTLLATTGLAAWASTAPARASDWPSQTIRLLVGYAVGGPADILARALAKEMTQQLGVTVLVESKVGGGGVVATDTLIGSRDGHTLLFNTTGGFSVKPHVTKLRHDPWKDVKPITVVTAAPYIFVARAGLGVRTLTELAALAKQKQGQLNMAVAGNGTINHLISGMFLQDAGVTAALVPYTGAAPSLQSLMAGETDFMVVDPGAALPLIKAGNLVALAVTDTTRLPFLPEVPTVAEAGFPGAEGTALWSLFAPASVPDALVRKLQAAVVEAGRSAEFRATVDARLMVLRTTSSEELTQMMRAEEVRYKKAIQRLNIQM